MDEFTKEQRMQIVFNDIEGLLYDENFKKAFLDELKSLEESGHSSLIEENELIRGMSADGLFYINKREVIKNFTDSFEKYGLIGTHMKTRNGQFPVPIIYATYISELRSLGYKTPKYEKLFKE
jgi:hypothetical protein